MQGRTRLRLLTIEFGYPDPEYAEFLPDPDPEYAEFLPVSNDRSRADAAGAHHSGGGGSPWQ